MNTLRPTAANTSGIQATLVELKQKHLPRLDWHDLFTIKDDERPAKLTDEDLKAMTDYFRQFVAPQPCIKCGSSLTGDMIKQFIGLATFTWGLANGEGFARSVNTQLELIIAMSGR